MPDRSNIRWSQLKVGLVALAAIAIAVTLIFLLTSSKGLLHHNVPLRTYMDDASGMAELIPYRNYCLAEPKQIFGNKDRFGAVNNNFLRAKTLSLVP